VFDLIIYYEIFDIVDSDCIDEYITKYELIPNQQNSNKIKIKDNNKNPPEYEEFDISDVEVEINNK
jgi:hypothetical protein